MMGKCLDCGKVTLIRNHHLNWPSPETIPLHKECHTRRHVLENWRLKSPDGRFPKGRALVALFRGSEVEQEVAARVKQLEQEKEEFLQRYRQKVAEANAYCGGQFRKLITANCIGFTATNYPYPIWTLYPLLEPERWSHPTATTSLAKRLEHLKRKLKEA